VAIRPYNVWGDTIRGLVCPSQFELPSRVKYAPLQIPSSFANVAEAGLLMLPFGRMDYQLQYERKMTAASTWITAEQLPRFLLQFVGVNGTMVLLPPS
jgi:hypothetical protein